MRLTILSWLLALALVACDSESQSSQFSERTDEPQPPPAMPSTAQPSQIDLWIRDDGIPIIEYQGIGKRKTRGIAGNQLELIIDQLPAGTPFEAGGINDDPKYHVVELSATYGLGDDDSISLNGTLMTKHPVSVKLNWMTEEGSDEESHTQEYQAGEHQFSFRGKVTGWLETQGR